MKVFILNSSPRGAQSQCEKFIFELESEISKYIPDVVFSYFSFGQELDIHFNKGTSVEFITGRTPYNDDMCALEREMLESNIIILASPVYASAVNAQMKLFIDRIAYWMHLYRLAGKFGIVISAASSNSTGIVNDYLQMIMSYLGVYTVDKVALFENTHNMNEYISKRAQLCVKQLLLSINSEIVFEMDAEDNFQKMKRYILSCDTNSHERIYWDKNGMLKYESLTEMHNMVRSNRSIELW